MKHNTPVTDREVLMKDNTILVTKTDLKGKITFANDDFIEISGFTAEELIGSDHNIVRHPDMPVEAFADLWATINQGKPWRQLVKNRTKAGDYYWVEANVTPIYKNNNIEGFLSVRYSPSRDEIRCSEQFYDQLRNHKATIRPSGFFEKINFIKRLSVKNKLIISSLFFLVPALLAILWVVKEKNMIIEFAQQEVLGTEYHIAFTGLLLHIGDYSGISNQNIKIDTSAVEQIRHIIDADITVLDSLDTKYGEILKTSQAWRAIKQNWVTLSTENTTLLTAEDIYQKQSKFIESLYTFIGELNDHSNLILDPDLDSYWLMDMNSIKLPELVERLVFLRSYLALNYNSQLLTEKQKIDLMVKYQLAQTLFDKATESAAKATHYNDTVAAAVSVKRASFESVVQQYLKDIRSNLIEGESTASSSEQYFNAGTKAIQSVENLYIVGENSLKQLLENRIHKVEQEKWELLAIVFTLLFCNYSA
ncbi:PAS domain-containing protein [Methylomonas sp. AM2-LC]|uniref:PAS domain-containing protein n=1 Tax=Methylomonas sp. AM2-LC TaxID=3153301 RepID=UPI003264D5E7